MLHPRLHRRSIVALVAAAALAACEPTTSPEPRSSSPESGMLAVAADLLVVASPDTDEVLVVDVASREVRSRIAVGDQPEHVLVDGGRAFVSTRYGHTVEVIDIQGGRLEKSITVGVEPLGMTKLDQSRIAVVVAGEQSLAVVNHDEGRVEKSVRLRSADPRAVAKAPNGKLFVTHMTAGRMSIVDLDNDLDSEAVDDRAVNTMNDFGMQTHPNLMRSITLSPDGESVMTAHTQANADQTRAPITDGVDDPFASGDCGYSGCASELPAVSPGVTEVDVESGTVITPQPAALDEQDRGMEPGGGGFAEPDCFDCGFGMVFPSNPPSILNPNEARFGGIPLNNATALALFADGRGLLVVNTGSRNVVMLRRELKGTADDVLGVVNVGHGAFSVGVSQDGTRAFVYNQFDGTITEFELPDLGAPPRTASKYVPAGDGQVAPAEFREVPVIAAETWQVTEDVLEPEVSFGRKLFHDALDGRISQSHSVSCANCHPDGRNDGRTWQFTFGPRNTPQLGGGILDTAPFHWPGDVTTHRDLNTLTVLAFMGGTGLDVDSMDRIGAFIDTIRAAPSELALASDYPEAVYRGQEIFDSPEAGCTDCHTGDHFTDNKNWDVGTRQFQHDRADFQTPVLHGLSRSGPYLHDGSQQTLEDLVNNVIRTDRMGRGSHLTDQDAADLVEYLKTL